MDQQIVLISYIDTEVHDLRAKLQAVDPRVQIETALNMRQGFQRLSQHPAHLIVMNFDYITDIVYKHVRNLRSVVDKCPLLVLGKVDQADVMTQLSNIGNSVILEKPYDDKDLTGLTSKILAAREVYQRVHRRFNTAQRAHIEIYGKNVESDSTVLNLSRGGAYMELPKAADIVIGDLARVNVDLDQTKHNYRMHAKVVWITKKNMSMGEYGVGVEFIRPGDVFREMQGR